MKSLIISKTTNLAFRYDQHIVFESLVDATSVSVCDMSTLKRPDTIGTLALKMCHWPFTRHGPNLCIIYFSRSTIMGCLSSLMNSKVISIPKRKKLLVSTFMEKVIVHQW